MGIRRLTKSDIETAAEVAARAFHDDAAINYWFPNAQRRRDCLNHLFRLLIGYSTQYGEAYLTVPHPAGFAVWLPNDKAEISVRRALGHGGLKLLPQMGIRNLLRLQKMGNDATRLRQAYASEDGWFLAGLGVVPECQRQGYGTSLLRPVLRRLDEQGLDCYLDTEKQANLDYYRRFGFEVIATMEDPKYKITTWGMRRPPQVETD